MNVSGVVIYYHYIMLLVDFTDVCSHSPMHSYVEGEGIGSFLCEAFDS